MGATDGWSSSPELLNFWSQIAYQFREAGRVREVILRPAQAKGPVKSLAITVDLEEHTHGPDGDAESAASTGHSPGGILHFLPPFELTETLTATSLIVNVPPWTAPSLVGLTGYPENDPTEKVWFITFEQPLQQPSGSTTDRKSHERLHIDRFVTDFGVLHGVLPYDQIFNGDEPPDFVCTNHNGRVGVECTQLAVEERRAGYGLFRRVRKAVAEAAIKSRYQFSQLSGGAIYMHFQDPNGHLGLPPVTTHTDAVDEIVERLAEYHPDIEALVMDSNELPEQAPLFPIGSTTVGCRFHAAPFVNALPNTEFFVATGFELGVGLSSRHSPDSAWQQIDRVIQGKDKTGTDELLITVGGPDREGYSFPSEALIAELALQYSSKRVAVHHLSRVWMHFWSSGRIVQLYPYVAEGAGALYGGNLVPSHMRL